MEKRLRVLKCDLKNYYNSTFFREDSILIKKIHSVVSKIDVSNPQQSDNSLTIRPSDPPQSPVPLPTSRPPLRPLAPPLPDDVFLVFLVFLEADERNLPPFPTKAATLDQGKAQASP